MGPTRERLTGYLFTGALGVNFRICRRRPGDGLVPSRPGKMLSDVLSAVADGRLKLAPYARARKARDDISALLDGIGLPPSS